VLNFSRSRRRFLRCAAAGAASLLPACRRETADKPPATFADGALRFELRHFVRSASDTFDLLRLRVEPHWRAPKERLDDILDWGDYRLSMSDAEDGAVLFRTGFDSNIDAHASAAATTIAVRFPLPQRRVHVTVERRRPGSIFQAVWQRSLDPLDAGIDRSPPRSTPEVTTVMVNGPAATKVDITILGEGYTLGERTKFVRDAERAAGFLFSVDPFASRMRDFNVHAVFVASAESGATDAYLGVHRHTAFGCAYGSAESERTLAVRDIPALYEAASAVPYDFVLVLVNARRYGGSAWFGGPATVAIDSAAARYLVLHEFAHVIGGLAEEYYIPAADGPRYRGNLEPWNPNVTTAATGEKWGTLVSGGRVEREAWNKAEYEKYFAGYVERYSRLRASHADERLVERFMQVESRRQETLLAKTAHPGRIGLFEGANGYGTGVFRSQIDCIMFSLQTRSFCIACRSAIDRMIRQHIG
jgi:hypothetical protein